MQLELPIIKASLPYCRFVKKRIRIKVGVNQPIYGVRHAFCFHEISRVPFECTAGTAVEVAPARGGSPMTGLVLHNPLTQTEEEASSLYGSSFESPFPDTPGTNSPTTDERKIFLT